MIASNIAERTVNLPDRPWLIGGGKAVCLVRVQDRTLVPVFRSATATRGFIERLGDELPAHFYPQFPDEDEFVHLLAAAMRGGADGYVLVDDGCWSVIGFTASSRLAAMCGEPVEVGV